MQKTRHFPGSVDEGGDRGLQGERNFLLSRNSNSSHGWSAESSKEQGGVGLPFGRGAFASQSFIPLPNSALPAALKSVSCQCGGG